MNKLALNLLWVAASVFPGACSTAADVAPSGHAAHAAQTAQTAADAQVAHAAHAAQPAHAEHAAEGAEAGTLRAPAYTLVLLKTGPADGEVVGEERQRAFQGHFENMGRMANERQLVVAGPFGNRRHDPTLRGLFVMNSGQRDVAAAWAGSDPTTARGVFVQEYHALATDAPLVLGLERDLEREARDEAEGREPDMAASMRTYVLLIAEHGDLALPALAPLAAQGRVFVLGTLDGTRAIAWLDAADLGQAERDFGAALAGVGTYTLDEWYGSVEISRLGLPAR